MKKSLKMVAEFTQNSHVINGVSEFMAIQARNKMMLQEYVEAEKDDFVKELINLVLLS